MGGNNNPVVRLMLGEMHGSRGTPEVGSIGLAVVDEDIYGFGLQENLQFAYPLCHKSTGTKDEVWE